MAHPTPPPGTKPAGSTGKGWIITRSLDRGRQTGYLLGVHQSGVPHWHLNPRRAAMWPNSRAAQRYGDDHLAPKYAFAVESAKALRHVPPKQRWKR